MFLFFFSFSGGPIRPRNLFGATRGASRRLVFAEMCVLCTEGDTEDNRICYGGNNCSHVAFCEQCGESKWEMLREMGRAIGDSRMEDNQHRRGFDPVAHRNWVEKWGRGPILGSMSHLTNQTWHSARRKG